MRHPIYVPYLTKIKYQELPKMDVSRCDCFNNPICEEIKSSNLPNKQNS